MTISDPTLEPKVVKSTPGDGSSTSLPCACSGNNCHRSKHIQGSPCDRNVVLNDKQRHKVCNGCRKQKATPTKKEQNQGAVALPQTNVALPIGAVPPMLTYVVPGMPAPISGDVMGGVAVPQMTVAPELSARKPRSVNSQYEETTITCICEKPGACHREKHSEGPCDRTVKLTRGNRHKVCNGCRKAKKTKGESREVPAPLMAYTSVNLGQLQAVNGNMPMPMSGIPQGLGGL